MRHKHVALKIRVNDAKLKLRAYEIIVTDMVFTYVQRCNADKFKEWAKYRLEIAKHFISQRYDNCTPGRVQHCKKHVERFRNVLAMHVDRGLEVLKYMPERKEGERYYALQYYLNDEQRVEWDEVCRLIENTINYYGDAI